MFSSALKGSLRVSTWASLFALLLAFADAPSVRAQSLPINIQGRIAVDGIALTSANAKFKFALVNANGSAVLWTHDGTSSGVAFEPTSALTLNVSRGLYSLLLGDTTVAGMTQTIAPSIFNNPDVRLRIWFSDDVHGFQRLTPDQRLSAVGYAMTSEKAKEAAVLTGTVNLSQIPSTLITNNATNITLTGSFSGDGSGLVGIRGSTPWQVVNGTSIAAFPNTGYLVTNLLETTVAMPASASLDIGDVIRVAAPAGSWKVTLQAGQQIKGANILTGLATNWVKRSSSARSSVASTADGVRLIAGSTASGRILYSRDSGLTWTNSTSAADPIRAWKAVASSADGSRLLAAGDNGPLYLSRDGADTWNSVSPNKLWRSVSISGDGTNLFGAISQGILFASNDGGETWKDRTGPGVRTWNATAANFDGSRLYAANSSDGLYLSTDRSTNWTLRSSIVLSLLSSSYDGLKLAGVSNGQIVTSTDGGANWIPRPVAGNRVWTSIVISSDGSRIIGVAGNSYVSVNSGITWTTAAGGGNAIAASADLTKLVAVSDGGGIFTSQALPTQVSTVGGFLIGSEFSSVELQYIGGGAFFILTSAGNLFAY